MAVITISRQLGSLGCDIARRTSEILGYRLVWRDLINKAARRAGTPEMALAAIDELGLLDICPSDEACQAYTQAIQQVMTELADQGDIVIVGRAGQVILSEYPQTFHMRIIAPPILRAKRISIRHNITLECAQAQVETSDKYRYNYLQRFYNVDWETPELYHMVINTGKVSPQDSALLVCEALNILTSNPKTVFTSSQDTNRDIEHCIKQSP